MGGGDLAAVDFDDDHERDKGYQEKAPHANRILEDQEVKNEGEVKFRLASAFGDS